MLQKLSIRLVAIIMVLCMVMSFFTACSNEENTSSDSDIIYGNDIDDIDDDDEDYDPNEIVINTGGDSNNNDADEKNEGSGNKNNNNNNNGGAVEYEGNNSQTHAIDEGGKKDFLDTIPKSLKGKTVKILVWWKPSESETKKMEYFTKKTGIKVKWIQTDLDVYYQKLSGLKAQKNSPDLACINQDDFPTAILKDYFQPLSVGKLDLSKEDVFDIESMNKFKWNGKHYGALVKGSTMITFGFLVYNQDMFNQAGIDTPYDLWKAGNWNWDTFLSTAQTIKSKTGKAALTAEYQGFRLVQTAGQDAIAIKNGNLANNIGNKAYRDAWKWVNNLGIDGQYKVADWGLNRDGFFNQKCAMAVEENWAMQKGERYENLKFSWGYVPLPCPKGSSNVVPSDAKLWGFPVGAKNAEAASYVLEYWQNPIYDVEGYETWINDSVASFNDSLWEMDKTFKISGGVVEYGGDYDYFSNYIAEIALSGVANVDTIADKWSKVIDANIKKINDEFK